MTFSRPKPNRLERYATYGLERLIVVSPSADLQDESFTLRHLDELAPIVEEWRPR